VQRVVSDVSANKPDECHKYPGVRPAQLYNFNDVLLRLDLFSGPRR
jgi:hypothetical protein